MVPDATPDDSIRPMANSDSSDEPDCRAMNNAPSRHDNPSLSVIVCTHNPRDNYLSRVLGALRDQTHPLGDWELLIVDNHSDRPLAGRCNIDWHPHGRHLVESTIGLTAARLRGIAETTGELIVFVDDDNILNPDYLEQALHIGQKYPFLGAWGGRIDPEFEVEPPEWTRKYWDSLAIRDVDRDIWSNLLDFATAPCGAGLCVRREVAHEYRRALGQDQSRISFDRQGSSLSSGGDSDLALTACDIGLGTGLFTALQLTHLIPSPRLELEYLARLSEELEYSSLMLRALRGYPPLPTASHDGWFFGIGRLYAAYARLRTPAHDRAIEDARARGRKRALATWQSRVSNTDPPMILPFQRSDREPNQSRQAA